jgi:hypothetical protein
MIDLPNILPESNLPHHLPTSAKWLAGEGAGSWFVIEKTQGNSYKITRFSPEGNIECENLFQTDSEFALEEDFTITYLV